MASSQIFLVFYHEKILNQGSKQVKFISNIIS